MDGVDPGDVLLALARKFAEEPEEEQDIFLQNLLCVADQEKPPAPKPITIAMQGIILHTFGAQVNPKSPD